MFSLYRSLIFIRIFSESESVNRSLNIDEMYQVFQVYTVGYNETGMKKKSKRISTYCSAFSEEQLKM